MVQLQYFDGENWADCGEPWANEQIAWISLGGDDYGYRTVDTDSNKTLTDKS